MIDRSYLLDRFNERYETTGEKIHIFFAPGRVNIIGEHIDYNGGSVMPVAISLGSYLVVRKRKDKQITLQSTSFKKKLILNSFDNLTFNKEDDWTNYPKGIFQAFNNKGFGIGGADTLLISNLPIASGLSSSASIELLYLYAFMNLFNANHLSLLEMALLCKDVENNFIGVNCGIMDQFAIALSKKNNALYLNCNTLEAAYIKMELGDYTFVILNSNKPRKLINSAFNERRNECNILLSTLNKYATYTFLCEAHISDLDKVLSPILKRRLKHVITEKNRVDQLIDFINKGLLEDVGQLLNESHQSLKIDYEVSCEELDFLVATAQRFPYCLGARMTGAGFGGCAIALIEKKYIYDFSENIVSTYYEKYHINAEVYMCEISDGVRELIN